MGVTVPGDWLCILGLALSDWIEGTEVSPGDTLGPASSTFLIDSVNDKSPLSGIPETVLCTSTLLLVPSFGDCH